jgi:hypothetical protein
VLICIWASPPPPVVGVMLRAPPSFGPSHRVGRDCRRRRHPAQH